MKLQARQAVAVAVVATAIRDLRVFLCFLYGVIQEIRWQKMIFFLVPQSSWHFRLDPLYKKGLVPQSGSTIDLISYITGLHKVQRNILTSSENAQFVQS